MDFFTTAFIMTNSENGCIANCAFCPQARTSQSSPELLSRIGWPKFDFGQVLNKLDLGNDFERICIQSLNYPSVVDDVEQITKMLRMKISRPISTCIHPISIEDMQRLKNAGITNIGIAVDACTPELFDEIKGKIRHGPYRWERHMTAISEAVKVFGEGNATTHLIVGLGETEREAAEFLFTMAEQGIRVALFAFTGVKGTALEQKKQPSLEVYRRLQILRYLITGSKIERNQIDFDDKGSIIFNVNIEWLRQTLTTAMAFQTSGCVGCNRPYYNERPRGPMYNYPHALSPEDLAIILENIFSGT